MDSFQTGRQLEATNDIFALIRSRIPDLTRNQQRLAEFALKEQQAVAFSTVTELAEQTAISPATIVRFAKSLGFEGYNGLQREVRRSLRAELRGPDRFRHARKPDPRHESLLTPAIEREQDNIAALQDYHDPEAMAAAVQAISGAARVVVIGSRSTASLANHFWFALNKLGLNADRALSVDTHAYEMVHRLDDRGCVVLIGFPRYLSELGEIAAFATGNGKRLVVITDSPFSPFKGDLTLYAPVESSSFVAFHCAPLILMATLLSEIAAAEPERTLRALDHFEDLAQRHHLFNKTRE